jgi:hypothetical protein
MVDGPKGANHGDHEQREEDEPRISQSTLRREPGDRPEQTKVLYGFISLLLVFLFLSVFSVISVV